MTPCRFRTCHRSSAQGFTLLEVLVATTIMGIAVVSLLSALGTSMRSAGRLADHDRMALLARSKMDEILIDYNMPLEAEFDGRFDAAAAGDPAVNGQEAGYHAVLGVFEAPPQPAPGTAVLQRVALHVWWKSNDTLRSLDLEAFRRNRLPLRAAQ